MDEFDCKAWERQQARGMRNIYPRDPMLRASPPLPPPSRWAAGNIFGGLLMVSIGGFLIWGAYDDLAEHFKPAQPVAVKQEAAPDITTQIRNLERMIAEAKQLNAEFELLHQKLTQLKDKLAVK